MKWKRSKISIIASVLTCVPILMALPTTQNKDDGSYKSETSLQPSECLSTSNTRAVQTRSTPSNFRYTEHHMWVELRDGLFVIGYTDHGQEMAGEIVYVDTGSYLGEKLLQYEMFGTLETIKECIFLFMPVSGEIIELNEQIDYEPDLINSDPYERGYIMKVKPSDIYEINDLLTSKEYIKLISQ